MNINIKKILRDCKKSIKTLREAINDAKKSKSFKTGAALIKDALKD